MTAIKKGAVALALAMLLAGPALAQSYPSSRIRIIVPFGAGGPADIYARVIAHHLSQTLNQSFVIENRPGGGAVIGTTEAAKAAPDGYTLLMMSNTHTANETLIPKKNYALMKDLVPVAPVNYSDLVIVVHPTVPAKTLAEFIALAKAKPGELNYASSGPGTPYHLAGENFKSTSGTSIVHVPHRGSGEARSNVIGGHVQMMMDAVTTMAPTITAGQVTALATTGPVRSERPPERADCRGGRPPRLRGDDLARHHGAGRDTAADRRSAQRGDRQGRVAAGGQGGLGEAGRDRHEDEPGRVQGVSRGRHREVGEGHRDGQDHGEIGCRASRTRSQCRS